MSTLTLLIALFSLVVGITVLWANPGRWLNRIFCMGAFAVAMWLGCVCGAMIAGARGTLSDVAFWLRLNAAVSAFLPLGFWLTKESVIASSRFHKLPVRALPWLSLGVVLSGLSYADSFLFLEPDRDRFERGIAYYIYESIAVPAYLYLVIDVFRQMRGLTGIQRIETQFLALNLGIAALAGALLTTFGNLLEVQILKRSSVVVMFSAYAASAWAITAYRIFDVRQVFTSLAQRIGLVALLTACVTWAIWSLQNLMPQPVALLLSISVFFSLAFWLDRKSRDWLDLDGERLLAKIRRAFIDVAAKEADPEQLPNRFSALLCKQCQTDFAALLFDRGETYATATLEVRKNQLGYTALCEIGWATPESLDRRRADPALAELHHFLTQNTLGVIVVGPRGSRQPSLLVALGTKNHSWPFTYPEVQRLQNIAELMDSILTRSRLAMQAAVQAKMEHLAMMSRGLAHDLRNLITPISSFLIHTDNRFPADSAEAEVHSAAQRSVRVMTDYVREALFFSERLKPNFETVDLGKLFATVRELTAARAAHRGVMIAVAPLSAGSFSADAVLIQRMLTNLVGNAIDASKSGQIVTLSAARAQAGQVRLQVVDAGAGISSENLGRIFDPYFTTKEFGDDVRGFGLGLTICQKIVHLHEGTISVTSRIGRGTTFTVDLPSAPTT